MVNTPEATELEPQAPNDEGLETPTVESQPSQPIIENPDDRFSLRMLGVENTETKTLPETPKSPEQKKQFFEAFARDSDAHTKGMESTLEPRRLAEGLGKMAVIDAPLLASYIEAKRRSDIFTEDTPESLSQELMKVENRLVRPLIAQLKSAELDLKPDQIENCLTGVREAFFGMILNQQLSADKIFELFDGQIKVSKEPGEEVSPEHKDVQDMASYLSWNQQEDQQEGKFDIHIYGPLFAEGNKDIAFLMRHEFMHAAAIAIWGEDYIAFKNAAKNPAENITAFAKIPELQQVLMMVADPATSKHFFRSYIGDLLEKAADPETSSADKAICQQRAAIEIVADMGAAFLEGSKTPDVFIDIRARYFAEQDPEKFIKTICELEGVADQKTLFKNYGVVLGETPPSEIIKKLSSSEKLRGLFQSSSIWQEQLAKKFENKGANLKRPEMEEEDMEGMEELELAGSIPARNSALETGTGQPKGNNEKGVVNAFLSLWDIITGKK